MNIKELLQISGKIADFCGVSMDDARRIVGFYSSGGDASGVDACGRLDFDAISKAAAAVGVVLADQQEKKKSPAGAQGSVETITAENRGNISENKPGFDADAINDKGVPKQGQNKPVKAQKSPKKEKDNNPTAGREKAFKSENIKQFYNDDTISPQGGADDSGKGKLPADFTAIIESLISDYCLKFNIEDMQKAAAVQWRACCSYIGMWAKENSFYIDKEKTARQGGKVFDAEKIAAAVPVWALLCGSYKKVPLITDFIEFAGVGHSWFYGDNGHCGLTSSQVDLVKKLSEIQAAGLASGIVDGRENPTGKIYFSKAVLGWSENSGGQYPQESNAKKVDALPVFGSSGGGFLPGD